ncbi:MAG: nucleoside/nucleotide kinase family protein, partial [Rubrimonas sp.]
GLAATLARLRAGDEDAVAVPVFDRAIEIARAGARLIDRETPLILVEGNYLLLSAAPWSALRAHFDRTALIRVDPAVLERRLSRRWLDAGLDPAEAARRVRENDMPNGLTVLTGSAAPDWEIRG